MCIKKSEKTGKKREIQKQKPGRGTHRKSLTVEIQAGSDPKLLQSSTITIRVRRNIITPIRGKTA